MSEKKRNSVSDRKIDRKRNGIGIPGRSLFKSCPESFVHYDFREKRVLYFVERCCFQVENSAPKMSSKVARFNLLDVWNQIPASLLPLLGQRDWRFFFTPKCDYLGTKET